MARPLSPATAAFGQRVRLRRQQLGLSQEALAERCGVHWTFLGQVERGQRNISLHNVLKVAHGLDIDPGELVSGLSAPDAPDALDASNARDAPGGPDSASKPPS